MSRENAEIVRRNHDRLNHAYETADYLEPLEEICHPHVVLRTTTFSVVHVWTIHGGKVARTDMFRSRAQALEAVGLWG